MADVPSDVLWRRRIREARDALAAECGSDSEALAWRVSILKWYLADILDLLEDMAGETLECRDILGRMAREGQAAGSHEATAGAPLRTR
jgi:hypothetical protein